MSTFALSMVLDLDSELKYGHVTDVTIQSYISKIREKEIEVLKKNYYDFEEREVLFQGFNKRVHTYGICHLDMRTPMLARITLTKYLLMQGNGEDLINVIAHEVLHGLLPFGEHHGYAFKSAMKCLNRELGLHIVIRGHCKLAGAVKPKYEVYCPDCGMVIGKYYRKVKLVKYPYQYRHKGCNCRLEAREVG